jgi:hypothetical protein
LIAWGHPPAEVWRYTPRQIRNFLVIANKRRQAERRLLLHDNALAARGDPKALAKAVREE